MVSESSIYSAIAGTGADVAMPAVPDPGRGAAERFVAQHLAGLFLEDEVVSSPRFRGGQAAADGAIGRFDVAGYAANRNEAYPEPRRGASGLSPYIRHGLLNLTQVWDSVDGGPSNDSEKFRDELLWQEYARHWYARLGSATARPLRRRYVSAAPTGGGWVDGVWVNGRDGQEVWNLDMACLELTVGELEDDGWLVNQGRMWLASQWTVRSGREWQAGEDYFFRHLLDGSRAANRLGWQLTTGVGSNRAYGFSRWQVEKRAPGLCSDCELGANCPIDRWPDDPKPFKVDPNPLIARDPDVERRRGPDVVQRGTEVSLGIASDRPAEAVWLTAESLGVADPALSANPDLPLVFVFDRPLLDKLQLSSKRLVFLVETLAELAVQRDLEIYVGDPTAVLADRPLATTFAPVPGWARRVEQLTLAELHPWPWLRLPVAGNIGSFGAWVKQLSER